MKRYFIVTIEDDGSKMAEESIRELEVNFGADEVTDYNNSCDLLDDDKCPYGSRVVR